MPAAVGDQLQIRNLANDAPPGGKWFRFLRYDVRLDPIWLKEHMGLDFTESEVERFRRMDDPGIIKNIYAIARLAAELQVKREHFFPDPPRKQVPPGQPMDAAAPPVGDGAGLLPAPPA